MNAQGKIPSQDLDANALAELRVDLAAAFRLAYDFGWHESVGNHFSAAVSNDGKRFLMNRKWQHFGSIINSVRLARKRSMGASI